MRTIIRAVAEKHRQIQHMFNLIPFTWFAFGVMSAPDLSTWLTAGRCDIATVVYGIFCFIYPLPVPLAVSSLQSSFIETVNRVQESIIECKTMSVRDEIILLRELDQLKEKQFTGFYFVILNRGFVLSYMGTIVTYAALIANVARHD